MTNVPPPPPSDVPPPSGGATPPPAAPQPSPYSAPAGGAAQGPKQILSLISMIGGIVGLVLSLFGGWGILFSIAAVVLGHMGQKRENHAKGFWITGLITGYLGIAIGLVIGLFMLFVFIAAIGSASYVG